MKIRLSQLNNKTFIKKTIIRYFTSTMLETSHNRMKLKTYSDSLDTFTLTLKDDFPILFKYVKLTDLYDYLKTEIDPMRYIHLMSKYRMEETLKDIVSGGDIYKLVAEWFSENPEIVVGAWVKKDYYLFFRFLHNKGKLEKIIDSLI